MLVLVVLVSGVALGAVCWAIAGAAIRPSATIDGMANFMTSLLWDASPREENGAACTLGTITECSLADTPESAAVLRNWAQPNPAAITAGEPLW